MRIAYVVDDITPAYQLGLWHGIQQAAKELGFQAIAVTGRYIFSGNKEDECQNQVFDYLRSGIWDGFVIAGATFSTFSSEEQTYNFFSKYNLPIVSIGAKLGDAPAVLVDNKEGLKSMVSHYIEKHNLKDFGFICGPDKNVEAQIRLNAFKEALEEHNLKINEDWIYHNGNFLRDSGRKGMSEIWRKNSRKPEAVIAASDLMALGAFDFTQEHKISVPEELRLGGYDNLIEGIINKVPLTTIKQPFSGMGYQAAKMLHKNIIEGIKPADSKIDTLPIYRESCGCLSNTITLAGQESIEPPLIEADKSKTFRENLDAFLTIGHPEEEISKLYSEELPNLLELFNYYIQESTTERLHNALFYLGKIMSKETEIGGSLEFWNNVISGLRFCYKNLKPELMPKVGLLIQKAYLLTSEKLFQDLSQKINMQTSTYLLMQKSMQNIMEARDLKSLLHKLAEELENLNFKSFYLILFDTNSKWTEGSLPQKSNILLEYTNGIIQKIDVEEEIDTLDFLPESIMQKDQSNTLLAQILTFEQKGLGVIICDVDDRGGDVFDAIRSQISSSVRAGLLIEEMEDVQRSLTAQNKEIKELVEPMLKKVNYVTEISSAKIAAIDEAATEMRENRINFSETTESIKYISESTKKMKKMISTIDDISERINVLSINASIESARAGEAGKGFGVISTEIRNLADNTAQTVQQTDNALQNVSNQVESTTFKSNQSLNIYLQTLKEVENLAVSFHEIKDKMAQVTQLSEDIIHKIE